MIFPRTGIRVPVTLLGMLFIGLAVLVPSATASNTMLVGLRGGISVEAGRELIRAEGGRPVSTLPFGTLEASGLSNRSAASLRTNSSIAFVEPNMTPRKLLWTPNDPTFTLDRSKKSRQWYLPALRVPQAWNLDQASGGGGFVGANTMVAVIDSGVDGTHPELTGRVIRGRNYVDNDGRSDIDVDGHGTSIASLIAASTGNGTNGAGVAPRTLIYSIKISNGDSESFVGDAKIGQAIEEAVRKGSSVINLSYGSPRPTSYIQRALRYAVDNGVLVTCAAGNEGAGKVSYPAAFPECLAVGSTNFRDKRSRFSNYGAAIDLVAPGERLAIPAHSLWDGVDRDGGGTSYAAPIVAGVAALLVGRGLNGHEAASILKSTARDLGKKGWDRQYGHGIVNAEAALKQALGTGTPFPPEAPSCLPPGSQDPIILYRYDMVPTAPVFCFSSWYDVPTVQVSEGQSFTAQLDSNFPYTGLATAIPLSSGNTDGTFTLRVTDAGGTSEAVGIDVSRPATEMDKDRARSAIRKRLAAHFGSGATSKSGRCIKLNLYRVMCKVAGIGSGGYYDGVAVAFSEVYNRGVFDGVYFSGVRFSQRCLKSRSFPRCARYSSGMK